MMDRPSESLSDDPAAKQLFDEALACMKEDPVQAKGLLRKASDMGCTASMVLLGDILIDGTDDEKAEAVSLFKKAYDAGDNMGSRNLGYCYALGMGVEYSKEKAAEWYRRSAENGNAEEEYTVIDPSKIILFMLAAIVGVTLLGSLAIVIGKWKKNGKK